MRIIILFLIVSFLFPCAIFAGENNSATTALNNAVLRSDLKSAKAALDNGAEVNQCGIGGFAPIAIAAGKNKIEMVKLLISRGADINIKCAAGMTPLMVSLMGENNSCVAAILLLDCGADVKIKSDKGGNALHSACAQKRPDIVKRLIEKGADVNAHVESLGTPLNVAASAGSLEVVKLLVEAGADVNSREYGNSTPLFAAAVLEHGEMVRYLLDKGADKSLKDDLGYIPLDWAKDAKLMFWLMPPDYDVNKKSLLGVAILHQAAAQDYGDVVKSLIEMGADINAADDCYGKTPLHYAAEYGSVSTFKALLENGADFEINAKIPERPPVYLAIAEDMDNILEVLINSRRVDIKTGTKGPDMLSWAVEREARKCVELLIAKGVNINALNSEGNCLLMAFAYYNNTDLLKYLLEKGLDVNVRNKNGYYAFAWLMRTNGHLRELCLLLVENGLNVKLNDRGTFLHAAAGFEDAALIISRMIAKGAQVDALDPNGDQPIHYAAFSGDLAGIEVLANAGANLNAKNYNKWTPLDLAMWRGDNEIIAFFKSKNAAVSMINDPGIKLIMALKNENYIEALKIANSGENLSAIAPGDGNCSALYWACEKNQKEIAVKLVEKGLDVNAKGRYGETPILIAASVHAIEIVELLLSKGADPNIPYIAGMTALDYVRESDVKLYELLRKHGAKKFKELPASKEGPKK